MALLTRRALRRSIGVALTLLALTTVRPYLATVNAAVITSLTGYWAMDEASGNALDAHGSNPLTDNNTVGAGTGKVSGGRDFEADSFDYFSHTDNADLSACDCDFTTAFWVNFEGFTPGFPALVAKSDPDIVQYGWMLLYNTSRNRFVMEASGAANGGTDAELDASTFGAASSATWYFVVAWHDSVNNLLGIAVNAGTADTTAYSVGVFDSSARFTVGARDSSGDQTQRFDGLIDEVGFWKKVLTSGERTYLYNAGAGRSYADIVAEAGGGGTPRQLLLGVGEFKQARVLPFGSPEWRRQRRAKPAAWRSPFRLVA